MYWDGVEISDFGERVVWVLCEVHEILEFYKSLWDFWDGYIGVDMVVYFDINVNFSVVSMKVLIFQGLREFVGVNGVISDKFESGETLDL